MTLPESQAPVSARGQQGVSGEKLVAWSLLVGALIVFGYVGQAASAEPPDRDILYRYSTAFAALVQYALMFAITLVIARGIPRADLGLVRPASWWRASAIGAVALLGVWGVAAALSPVLDAGDEQGLVPDAWDPERAGAFVANFAVVAIVAPVVEELLYRGLGYAVVRSYLGAAGAVVVTGVAFGLSHGLVVALPILSLFGMALAFVRWRTDSLYPAIAVHAVFNAAALLAAVTVGG